MTKRDPAIGSEEKKPSGSETSQTAPTLADTVADIRSRGTIDRPVSIEEMNEAIEEAACQRYWDAVQGRSQATLDNPEQSRLHDLPERSSSTRHPSQNVRDNEGGVEDIE